MKTGTKILYTNFLMVLLTIGITFLGFKSQEIENKIQLEQKKISSQLALLKETNFQLEKARNAMTVFIGDHSDKQLALAQEKLNNARESFSEFYSAENDPVFSETINHFQELITNYDTKYKVLGNEVRSFQAQLKNFSSQITKTGELFKKSLKISQGFPVISDQLSNFSSMFWENSFEIKSRARQGKKLDKAFSLSAKEISDEIKIVAGDIKISNPILSKNLNQLSASLLTYLNFLDHLAIAVNKLNLKKEENYYSIHQQIQQSSQKTTNFYKDKLKVSSNKNKVELLWFRHSVIAALCLLTLIELLSGFIFFFSLNKFFVVLNTLLLKLRNNELKEEPATKKVDTQNIEKELFQAQKNFEQQLDELNKLKNSCLIMNISESFDQILATAVEGLKNKFKVTNAYLYILTNENKLEFKAVFQEKTTDEINYPLSIQLGEGRTGKAAEELEIQLLPDLNPNKSKGEKHNLLIPLICSGKCLGIIRFNGSVSNRDFLEREKTYCLQLSEITGNSLRNIVRFNSINEQLMIQENQKPIFPVEINNFSDQIFLVFDENYTIDPVYFSGLKQLLKNNNDSEQMELFSHIFDEELKKSFDQIFNTPESFSEIKADLPEEIKLNNQILKLDYQLLNEPDKNSLLVIFTDITENKQLSQENHDLKKELEKLVKISNEEINAEPQIKLEAPFKYFYLEAKKLSQRMGKKIKVKLQGKDLEVPAKIMNHDFYFSIAHLIENSLEHGIEPSGFRLKEGKPEEGIILISAERKNCQLIISVADDGRGIDPDRIKQTAISKGLIKGESINNFNKSDAIKIIFSDGFTTAEEHKLIKGIGNGLFQMKQAVKRMQGDIKIKTTVKKGTVIKVSIPLN